MLCNKSINNIFGQTDEELNYYDIVDKSLQIADENILKEHRKLCFFYMILCTYVTSSFHPEWLF